MIVHEITGSPVSGFFHLSHKPAKLSTPPPAALMKYGWPIVHLDPLVVAADRNDAPMALECVAEHWLVGDGLGAGVE
jgi:hypothetical protein